MAFCHGSFELTDKPWGNQAEHLPQEAPKIQEPPPTPTPMGTMATRTGPEAGSQSKQSLTHTEDHGGPEGLPGSTTRERHCRGPPPGKEPEGSEDGGFCYCYYQCQTKSYLVTSERRVNSVVGEGGSKSRKRKSRGNSPSALSKENLPKHPGVPVLYLGKGSRRQVGVSRSSVAGHFRTLTILPLETHFPKNDSRPLPSPLLLGNC